MSKKIKIGFIGAGFVGQVAHLANYQLLEDAEMYALAEVRPELRKKAQAHFGIGRTYADHRELLADPEVAAVVAVTRRQHTGPLSLEILNAKKHLFCEKPFCHSLEQAERLHEVAVKNQLSFASGLMRRFDAATVATKAQLEQLLNSQELGQLTHVRAYCFGGESYCHAEAPVKTTEDYNSKLEEWPLRPSWLAGANEEAYAKFVNVYCHSLNLLRYFLGNDLRVEYSRLYPKVGGLVIFEYHGKAVSLEAGYKEQKNWEEGVVFHFEKGSLELEFAPAFLRNQPGKVTLKKPGQWITPQLDWSWAFANQAQHFVESLLQKKHPQNDIRDSLLDFKLIEDIWKMNKGVL